MKRFLVGAMAIWGVLAFAMPASSYVLGVTDVGGLDSFVESAVLANSGEATELQWLRDALNDQTLTYTKFNANLYSWTQVNGETTIWAAALQDSPEFYFLKVGASQGEDTHYLFENEIELAYAVINFLQFSEIQNIGAISHVGETGGGTSVPEPGTLMLLGGGLVGLALYGRKSFKR